MPLDDRYPWIVVFIVAPRLNDDGIEQNVPIGTGFVASVPSATAYTKFLYVITAQHVLFGERSQLAVRFTTKQGGSVDLPAPDWIDHPTEDVSAAPITGSALLDLRLAAVAESQFLDVHEGDQPLLGDTVYFIGLLAFVQTMADANVPMVRSGTLGAKYQDGIPIQLPDRTRRLITAHLIDCRSYRGFSGSPCFIQFLPENAEGWSLVRSTRLLGIVSAHFDMSDDATLEGDLLISGTGRIRVPIHSGIGVVVPVEHIREVLYQEELVEQRRRLEDQLAETSPGLVATADSTGDLPSEFSRFSGLTKALLKVPKRELDEKRDSG
ncbi:MAG: hypothetical protein M3256_16840 [Actinomycetota bacterium]|nr:hypothetical protein [Actinomycetota bacterium]